MSEINSETVRAAADAKNNADFEATVNQVLNACMNAAQKYGQYSIDISKAILAMEKKNDSATVRSVLSGKGFTISAISGDNINERISWE